MNSASDSSDPVDPENVLHTGAGDCAAIFLGHLVKTVGDSGRGRPWINSFLTGGNNVDAAGQAFFKMLHHIRHKAEQCHDRNIGVAFVQHSVGVISNGNIELNTVIANIHSDNSRIDVDGANNLRALLIEIPQCIF